MNYSREKKKNRYPHQVWLVVHRYAVSFVIPATKPELFGNTQKLFTMAVSLALPDLSSSNGLKFGPPYADMFQGVPNPRCAGPKCQKSLRSVGVAAVTSHTMSSQHLLIPVRESIIESFLGRKLEKFYRSIKRNHSAKICERERDEQKRKKMQRRGWCILWKLVIWFSVETNELSCQTRSVISFVKKLLFMYLRYSSTYWVFFSNELILFSFLLQSSCFFFW